MNNIKHTPGPWKLRKDYAITAHCNETESHEPIARAYGDGSIENLHANSQLIAAAPDLLEALEFVIRGVPDTWEGVQKARAAIAKATGGAK